MTFQRQNLPKQEQLPIFTNCAISTPHKPTPYLSLLSHQYLTVPYLSSFNTVRKHCSKIRNREGKAPARGQQQRGEAPPPERDVATQLDIARARATPYRRGKAATSPRSQRWSTTVGPAAALMAYETPPLMAYETSARSRHLKPNNS